MVAFQKINKKSNKLSEELIKEICKYIELGNYIETSCVMAKLSKATFYRYIKDANDETSRMTKRKRLCIHLRDSVQEAMAKATVRDLQNVERCAMGNKAVYLRYPEHVYDDEGNLLHAKGDFVRSGKYNNVVPEVTSTAPDWKASVWRLEKREGKLWGADSEHTKPKEAPITGESENNLSKMEIIFVNSDHEEGGE